MNIHKPLLEQHIQTQSANQTWLLSCIQGNSQQFPYKPMTNGNATIHSKISPRLPSTSQVVLPQDNRPQFVVNIPFAHKANTKDALEDLIKKFELLKLEGCGTTNQSSPQLMKQQVAVVVGINKYHSIDVSIDREFKRYIRNIPPITGIVHRIIGFLWKPVWIAQTNEPHIYPAEKAFLLLKAISAEMAEKVRQLREFPQGLSSELASQIPFQKIRETIKNSIETKAFIQHVHTHAPQAPIYFTIMDSDFLALRVQTGIFSRMTDHILKQHTPSIVCLGYQMKSDELPLIRLGVRLDMAVRQAMASVFPYSAYFCEPCTSFIVKRPGELPFLDQLSFKGKGRTLEARRFTQSGLKKKLFDNNVVYAADGGVTTSTPNRMFTLKNKRFSTLSKTQIKQKQCLKALRDISQTHATPKQWADNLYNGINFSHSRVTDVTTPMMYIFGVFDPLSRMFSAPHYSVSHFNAVIQDYDKPLSQNAQECLKAARATLWKLKMDKALIDNIEEAARRSGKAILNTLKSYL